MARPASQYAFLSEQLRILQASLTIEHVREISLLERLVSSLRDENRQLRNRLGAASIEVPETNMSQYSRHENAKVGHIMGERNPIKLQWSVPHTLHHGDGLLPHPLLAASAEAADFLHSAAADGSIAAASGNGNAFAGLQPALPAPAPQFAAECPISAASLPAAAKERLGGKAPQAFRAQPSRESLNSGATLASTSSAHTGPDATPTSGGKYDRLLQALPDPVSTSAVYSSDAANVERGVTDLNGLCPESITLAEKTGTESMTLFEEGTKLAEADPQRSIPLMSRAGKAMHLRRSNALDAGDSSDFSAKEVAMKRLRVRLGHTGEDGSVTGPILYQAVISLGLSKYSEQDYCDLISLFVSGGKSRTTMAAAFKDRLELGRGLKSKMFKLLKNFVQKPKLGVKSVTAREIAKSGSPKFAQGFHEHIGPTDLDEIPFDKFADCLLAPDPVKKWGDRVGSQVHSIKEVLVSGETSFLVAELAQVRVDDLACPPPSFDVVTMLEPLVSFVILVNAIVLGIETDEQISRWGGWNFIETGFLIFFTAEVALRIAVVGPVSYFFGKDATWSWFDVIIICFGFMEQSLNMGSSSTIFRILRLTRLARLIRILRFQCLKALSSMIRGLMAGLQTLGWSLLLLFSALYAIAVSLVETVGRSDRLLGIIEDPHVYFSTVPRAMFTAFRCFTQDCSDSEGRPLTHALFSVFGWHFLIPYTVAVMIITFGIVNLIIAVYIENSMAAAKAQNDMDKQRRFRETVRVAQTTKQLLKKFCMGAHLWSSSMGKRLEDMSRKEIEVELAESHHHDLQDREMTISKEVYLLVLQDREVQNLMDELDIQCERAHLFDVLDADGNGSLEVPELVHGFLRVRGELRKSDSIAVLLGVRALQDMVRDIKDCVTSQRHLFEKTFGVLGPPCTMTNGIACLDSRT